MAKTTKPRIGKSGTAWRHANIGRLLNNAVRSDAAHPMYPVGADGASQAIIDAHALADALAGQPPGRAARL